MPFEHLGPAPKRIAVIGAGISGMGAAHMLADTHRVVLFEAEHRLGGHARTKIAGKRGDQPVDTGFIVFNYVNYPNLTRLFEKLAVPVTKSNMTFAASIDGGRLEYALNTYDTLFAQRLNAVSPAFVRMIRDILRFCKQADPLSRDPNMTVGGLMDALGTGPYFRNYFLKPFSGAIWSTPVEKILDFPARAMIDFFRNHALLDPKGQHQWYTVKGGSIEYVTRLGVAMEAQGIDLRLGSPIAAVRRTAMGVEVRAHGGEWELFDEVVFSTHSDQALSMLADATPREKALLGDIKYQPNEVVLHADTSVMPKRRKCWASWNYTEVSGKTTNAIDMTYWMNSLQPIPMDDLLFVTLNSTKPIREDLIHDVTTLHHPVYDLAAFAAQKEIARTNGMDRTWFCGAWMKNGFHEDGLASAVDVVEAIGSAEAARVAAE